MYAESINLSRSPIIFLIFSTISGQPPTQTIYIEGTFDAITQCLNIKNKINKNTEVVWNSFVMQQHPLLENSMLL